jgi:2-methylcitrate dehydratase PrpD
VAAEDDLVSFVTEFDESSLTIDVRTTVRRVLLSALATGVAGAGEEGIGTLRALLLERAGRPEATSFVFGDRMPGTSAALLNATMCRALDFCDALAPGVHVGSSVVPAALAAAELAGGCDGSAFLSAVAVGVEVGSRFNLTERMYDGFDPTGVAAVWGAGATAARVLGLTREQTRQALAHAFNRCGGSFQSNIDGSLAVRLQQGIAAQNGVECAQWAQRGLTGPVNFLEGTYSFTHLYAKDLCRPRDFVAGLGDRWLLADFLFKRFPSCGVTQGVTEQALDVAAELDLRAGDVARVVVRMPPYSHRLVGNDFVAGANPRVSAQFSVKYCVASAIARRESTLDTFRPEMVLDPSLAPLLDRIDVLADPSMDARGHSSVDLALVTTDGRHGGRSYDVSPGYPGKPLDEAAHRQRFDDCMGYAAYPLTEPQVDGLVAAIEGIERIDDVRVLLPMLASSEAPGPS